MKKHFKNILLWIGVALAFLLIVSMCVSGILATFTAIYNILLKIGGGSIVWGIILAPFATIGIICVIRGLWAVMEKDGEKLENKCKHEWQVKACIIIELISLIVAIDILGRVL